MKLWAWIQTNGLLIVITGGIGYVIKLLLNLLTRLTILETKIHRIDVLESKIDSLTSKADQLIGEFNARKLTKR